MGFLIFLLAPILGGILGMAATVVVSVIVTPVLFVIRVSSHILWQLFRRES